MNGYPREAPYASWKAEKRRLRQIEEAKKEEDLYRAASEKNEKYHHMPASYRAFDDLVESVGNDTAEHIKALIESMIAERHD